MPTKYCQGAIDWTNFITDNIPGGTCRIVTIIVINTELIELCEPLNRFFVFRITAHILACSESNESIDSFSIPVLMFSEAIKYLSTTL